MRVNPNQTMYNYLLECNKNHMNNVALSFGDRKVTYEEFHDRVEKYAKMLRKKGINKGDVIAVCVLNTPESAFLLYALDLVGAITVGLSPFDNNEKIKHDLEITKPKYVISVDLSYSNIKTYEKALNFSTILYSPVESISDKKKKYGYKVLQALKGNIKFGKDHNLMSLLKDSTKEIELDYDSYEPGQLSNIMFTGGSTGVHKGVDLSGSGFNHVIEGMKYIYDEDFFEGKTYLGNIPMGHMAYGRIILHIALTNNMNYALTLKALPEDFYNEIVRTQAHAAVGGPPHWGSLIEKTENGFRLRSDLKPDTMRNLVLATSGGEALKHEQEEAINEAIKYCGGKTVLGDGLGATEASSVLTLNSGNYYKHGTVGVPIDTLEYKLVDQTTGKEVEDGKPGLLYVSGPSVMIGYHNNKEETDKVITYDENGKKWCNLGDILSKNADGTLNYLGRAKRNHVCGVDNVYPEQLEAYLNTFDEINESIVTFIPDDINQYLPIVHISLSSDNINTSQLERKLESAILKKFNQNWMPLKYKYYYEPLKRMINSKLDISYYQKIDDEELKESSKKLSKHI